MRSIDSLRPRSLRGRLTIVLAIGALALTTLLVAGFNVVLRDGLRRDANAAVRARASAALSSVEVRGARVRVREAPGDEDIDRQVWVVAGGRTIEAPIQPSDVQAAARAAARTPGRYRDVASRDVRLYALPIQRSSRTVGVVVAGISLGPYEHTAARALLSSVVLGALVLAAILAGLRLAVGAALRPVDRMTAEVAAWSADDLDRRLPTTGADDELSRLARTFNDLLARLAASFRHEQRFSAEVSHELRTPLAKLITESELALRRERTPGEYRAALEGIVRDARELQNVVDTLVAVARSEVDPRSGTSDPVSVAESVAGSLQRAAREGVELELRLTDEPTRLGIDGDLAERVLAPVVENALRYARAHAAISVGVRDGVVEFVVTDDGPGVPPGEREAIFAPGYRGTLAEPHSDTPQGAGLGLALARRLAVAAGGSLRCEASAAGGSAFVVTLPAA